MIDLDALDAMMEGVTAGPWVQLGTAVFIGHRGEVDDDGRSEWGGFDLQRAPRAEANAAFIAAARELVPALAAEVRAQQATIAALRAAPEAMRERVQHVKRGSTYSVFGRGKVQTDTPLTDYAEVMVYQSEDDGTVWVRPVSEFQDGRFRALPLDPKGDDND